MNRFLCLEVCIQNRLGNRQLGRLMVASVETAKALRNCIGRLIGSNHNHTDQ